LHPPPEQRSHRVRERRIGNGLVMHQPVQPFDVQADGAGNPPIRGHHHLKFSEAFFKFSLGQPGNRPKLA